MSLGTALKTSALFCNPENLDLFKRHIDPAWIDAALSATGKASVRRRRLPAEQVIWVVLGMALFQGRSIEDVITKLDLALPGADTIAPSSIAQARKRLGKEPLQWLFNRCARVWSSRSAQAHTYKGLSLYGIDGTSFRVPDSPKNREHFGGQSGRDGSQSGYPLVRMAALMVLSSHVIADAKFGAFEGTQEQQYATGLLDKIPTDSLTILDRGFFGASFLKAIESVPGRQWLVRGKANMSVRVVKKLGPRDELVEFTTSHCALAKDPSLPSTFLARRVNYKKRGFDRVYLLTSLFDAKAYPRDDIEALYHQRWEIELGYREIKTDMLEREETIRSQRPEGVYQEIWGILLAYNLVRVEMERIADDAKVEPLRVSFIESLRMIRDEWMWLSLTSPGTIPKRLQQMRDAIKRFILPPRRENRRFPRAVKIKMSNYKRKRPAAELK